ncbi:sugar transferase [Arthrobacter roseus]|uniref:sugar transferase n=1 Tax=Arthrobacter roseus TaxID=136274 RepID=UPI001EF78F7E|nr:sugar transferase [Arthrobacter roseus]MBM7848032.1 exopolysaccharide biosynthesis polyprenyl glycosylphosphotransferase [Arthrobacter roseus]
MTEYREFFVPHTGWSLQPKTTPKPAWPGDVDEHKNLPSITPASTKTVTGVPWRMRYQASLRITDFVIIAAAAILSANLLGRGVESTEVAFAPSFAALAGLVWIGMMSGFRTRDARIFGVGALEYKRIVHASAATFGAFAVVVVLTGVQDYRGLFLVTFPTGTLALVGSRWIWRNWLTKQREYGHFLSRVVVVGRLQDVEYVSSRIAKTAGAAYDVVGAVVEGPCPGDRLGGAVHGIPLTRGLRNVEHTVAESGADAVIVAGQLRKGGNWVRELGWNLERSGTELVVASSLTNVAGPRIQMRPVEGLPLMHVELPQFTGGRHVVKRCIDISAALLALIVLMPLLLTLGLLVVRDSTGPALFRQERVGRQGGTFRMLKFRSMVTTAEADLEKLRKENQGNGVLFKLREDPRVTRVGTWMRKYSLDELPQLWNVVRGEMSLVGPRPPLPSEVNSYAGHTHRRLYIKPGLTGLWQINGRSDLDWEESVRLDLYYVENWSVTGDLMIMWRTFKVMLKPEGAY